MVDSIIKFINILRSMNIRISIAETIDSIKAIEQISIENKEDFKTSLCSILIKDYENIKMFNKIFNMFFIYKEETKQIEVNEQQFDNLFTQMQQSFDNFNNEIGQEKNIEYTDFKQQEFEQQNFSEKNTFNNNLQNKIDMFSMGGDEQLKQEAKQIANSINYNKQTLQRDIENTLIKQGYEMSKTQSMTKQNQEFIENKYEKLKQYIQEEVEKNKIRKSGITTIKEIMDNEDENFYNKDFIELSKCDIKKIQKLLDMLIRKMYNIYIRKKIKGNKGSIDIKTTIRKSIKSGVIKDIYYKKRKKEKTNLVLLCDISGSMLNYIKFILQIIIGIEQIFKEVRIYVFMEKLKEITEDLKTSEDIINTVETIYRTSNLGYGTDYGNTLFWFSKKHFDKKTKIIIIGDAKNGGEETGENYLFDIKQKCQCIYWLNPVKENEWDDNFNNYKYCCKQVFECSNLKQLESIIRKII